MVLSSVPYMEYTTLRSLYVVCVFYIFDKYLHLLHLLTLYTQHHHNMPAYITEKTMCIALH